MPKMDFDFRGFVRGATVTEATNTDGEKVDVSKMSGAELENRLNDGELCITLGDHLYESSKNEVEMLDFKATPVWPDVEIGIEHIDEIIVRRLVEDAWMEEDEEDETW